MADAFPPRVAIFLKGYPRLSETFIAQEIAALEQRGLEMELVSLRHPTDRHRHSVHAQIKAPVRYLPEYLYRQPGRVLRGWWRARRLAGYRAARTQFLADLRRDLTPNRVRRFGQACVAATELPLDIAHLHAHFLHTPASVARYAAMMRGLKWSCSAHARDIWITPDWEKREKLDAMDWLVTCTRLGFEHLAALARDPGKLELVYHGLDAARFPAPPDDRPARDGSQVADPVLILSVGRAVAKKGYDDLLAALTQLPADLHWRFVHIGGGALHASLKQSADTLGLSARIEWRGAAPQDRVIAAYREADLFVLASKIDPDGDRDGLPNVLMEAQSQALACIATTTGAIPELVVPDETGVLVPPGDIGALASAISALARDPNRRAAIGRAGARRVAGQFVFARNVGRIAARFGIGAPHEPRHAEQDLPEAACASPSTHR